MTHKSAGYRRNGSPRNWNQQNLNGPLTDKNSASGLGDRMAAIRDAVGPDVDIIAEMQRLTDTTGDSVWPHDRRTGHLLLRRAGHAVKSRTDEAGCR